MEETPDEQLLDAYLDALLEDPSLSPEAFLASRDLDGASLVEHLRTVFRTVQESRRANGSTPVEGLVGRRLGDFLLLRRLGEGGMGVVYLANQESLGREVAVKILRPEFARSATAVTRFEREARAVAKLDHPAIARIHAVGQEDGLYFLAMEYLPGTGLDELLRNSVDEDRPLAIGDVLRWCVDLADALQAAHDVQIVHRDVKPSNIRITPEGRARLLDFGVARELDGDLPTLTGTFLGSPAYMAPEQIARRGGRVDGRTDVYSLGVTMYQCLTHRNPFEGDTVEQIFHQVLDHEPPAPRTLRPSLSRDLETVTCKAIEKDPERRYVSAARFRDDLNALLQYRPIQARPQGPLVRLRKLARRHPVAATAAGMTLVLLAILPLLWQGWSERQRQTTIGQVLDDARHRIGVYRDSFAEVQDLESQVDQLMKKRETIYITPEEDSLLERGEDEIVDGRLRREEEFSQILESLRRAEQLGASPAEVGELRGLLYLTRSEEAAAKRDTIGEEFYRRRALESDPNGRIHELTVNRYPTRFASHPAGATAYLFRMAVHANVVEGGESRLVAVPYHGTDESEDPGQFALEVMEGQGGVHAGDLILELAGHPIQDTILVTQGSGDILPGDRLVSIGGAPIHSWHDVATHGLEVTYLPRTESLEDRDFVFATGADDLVVTAPSLEQLGVQVATAAEFAMRGGAPAVVWSDGRRTEHELPPGLRVRVTATPFFCGPGSRIGITPVPLDDAPVGSYFLILRHPEFEEWRGEVHVSLGRATEGDETWVELLPLGSTPRGFVAITSDMDGPEPFWIQEHEVTYTEYLEFVNDPTSRQTGLRRDPRSSTGVSRVIRRPDGTASLADGWPGDLPVYGVSWHDAVAYAEWRTRRARDQGQDVHYGLPTLKEWRRAGLCHGQEFPFGRSFHPKWVSCAGARPNPYPARVASFPRDRSILGAFDMAGNVSEWLDEWWLEDRGFRRHTGGSWGHAGPWSTFRVEGGNGSLPAQVADVVGFRLVMRSGPAMGDEGR